MNTRLFHRGEYWTIESLESDGHIPAEEFLNSIVDVESREGRARASLLATIRLQADQPHGHRLSETRFKAVTDIDGIFEFKADQLRLFCFFVAGMRIVLVNGYLKKSDKDKGYKAAVERAARYRTEFSKDQASVAKSDKQTKTNKRNKRRKGRR